MNRIRRRPGALLLGLVGLLLAREATAGTRAKSNVIPVFGRCNTGAGTCYNGKPGSCTADADCQLGALSTRSRLQVDGKLRLKGSFTGVTDGAGTAVTTDGVVGNADDYVLEVAGLSYGPGQPVPFPNGSLYIKVSLEGGTGKVSVDLSTVADVAATPPGAVVAIAEGTLFAPVASGAMCAGDNSGSAIAAREGDTTCRSGGLVGVKGVQSTVPPPAPPAGSCASAGCPPPVACDTGQGACWQPPLATRLQYQLQAAQDSGGNCMFPATGGINVNITSVPFTGGAAVAPDVFDIDFLMDPVCAPGGGNDTDNTAAVSAIHANGGHVLCYLDAGTDEPFRPDHQLFVNFDNACGGCLLGKSVGGFREEHWLNVNDGQGQRSFILARVGARLDRCKADGFDAVEYDNVEGYANDTGFPISYNTQLLFNAALANLAHQKGLTVGLKNDLGQIADLLPFFDMAVNEQCQQFSECSTLDPFIADGKAVFQVEYNVSTSNACPGANAANRNASKKTVDLFDVPWTPCR